MDEHLVANFCRENDVGLPTLIMVKCLLSHLHLVTVLFKMILN